MTGQGGDQGEGVMDELLEKLGVTTGSRSRQIARRIGASGILKYNDDDRYSWMVPERQEHGT